MNNPASTSKKVRKLSDEEEKKAYKKIPRDKFKQDRN